MIQLLLNTFVLALAVMQPTPTQPASPAQSSPEVERIFQEFDADRDNRLSRREFLRMLQASNPGKDVESVIDQAFVQFDQNGDGFATRGEVELLKARQGASSRKPN
ncbi:MAG: hypothetical protein ACK41P_00300 [Asticcacaulis sp.]